MPGERRGDLQGEGGWDHADLAVEASVVEPVDVLQCGQFEIVEPTPGTVGADEFGFEQWCLPRTLFALHRDLYRR